MAESQSIQEQHTAGAQAIGFDYQFYYFMLLALELRHGQKIGFEVKDDVHIDKGDGTTTLFQTKHTVVENADGTVQNLTTLDSDLWKTLSNWADFIKTGNKDYLEKHSFVLVTNKNENNNDFIKSLIDFKTNKDYDKIIEKLNELKTKTRDETIQKYIDNLLSLDKTKLSTFLSKLIIDTGIDEILEKVKEKILEKCVQDKFVVPIFEKLSSNFQETKYTDIKNRKNFEISFDDFKNKFGKCFQIAFQEKSLPKRELPILLPEDLESQTFIKQLIDIGEISSGSKYVEEYTTKMLKALNHFSFWVDENFVLPTDMDDFKKNSIHIWANEFRAKYRQVENKISSGSLVNELENDIKNLAIELVDYMRKQDLSIPTYPSIGVEFSNGHFYALSDKLEIGWHFDWQNKYRK